MSSFKSFFNQTWIVALLVIIIGAILICTTTKCKATSEKTEDKQ